MVGKYAWAKELKIKNASPKELNKQTRLYMKKRRTDSYPNDSSNVLENFSWSVITTFLSL